MNMLCNTCGVQGQPGDKFCRTCGGAVVMEQKAQFCTNCGVTVPSGANFCAGCGTKTGEAQQVANMQTSEDEEIFPSLEVEEIVFHISVAPGERILLQEYASMPPTSVWSIHKSVVITLTTQRFVVNEKPEIKVKRGEITSKVGKAIIELNLEDFVTIGLEETTPIAGNPNKRMVWPSFCITTKAGDHFQFFFAGTGSFADTPEELGLVERSGAEMRDQVADYIKKRTNVTEVSRKG